MKIVGMIPARMASSRFPNKPLAPIFGKPMIEHVYHRCAMAKSLSEVYIATCDTAIEDAVKAFGGNVVMTADTHERASDRIAEAACSVDADVYVLIQGDEPMTNPDMIDLAVTPFQQGADVACVNLTKRIDDEEDFLNPDTIKVVMDLEGNALYMSRNPVPSHTRCPFSGIEAYKQVCIIPFTRDSLATYTKLAPTPLEIAESVDMMRFIEHGYKVRMVKSEHDTHAVDRPADLERVAKLMESDPLTKLYMAK